MIILMASRKAQPIAAHAIKSSGHLSEFIWPRTVNSRHAITIILENIFGTPK